MTTFLVHEQLLSDSYVLGDGTLSRVLLSKDARYPWLILVPRIGGLRDFHEVPSEHQSQLFTEINQASGWVKSIINADKVNVAALGNQVPQLHVHVIGRLIGDEAWPGPIWGVGTPQVYEESELKRRQDEVMEVLKLKPID